MQTSAGADGGFTISASEGTVVFARAVGFALGWTRLQKEGSSIVVGGRPPTTRLLLRTAGGQPVPGAALAFVSMDGTGIPTQLVFEDFRTTGRSPRTDSEGVLLIDCLPIGTYAVLLRRSDGFRELGAVAIPSFGEVLLRVPDGD